MVPFISSFLFVVLAEMGDKTQLLAMAFASRYKASQVLIAVFLATVLNHAIAVLVGRLLTQVVPLSIITFAAALSFIAFGLWTLRGDTLDGEDRKVSGFGPVLTVGIAFFLAEMGDKTQLATISLAVKYQNWAWVLAGTTLGMVVADAFGICIGVVMKKHIPDSAIKIVSACIFILFGVLGVYEQLKLRFSWCFALSICAVLTACAGIGGIILIKKNPRSKR